MKKFCWLWRLLCAVGSGFLAFFGLTEVPDDVVKTEHKKIKVSEK